MNPPLAREATAHDERSAHVKPPAQAGGPTYRSPVQRIDHDLPCVRCGYNLRMLAPDAACPECGEPVATSIAAERAARPAPWQRKRLQHGAGWIGASAGAQLLTLLVLVLFEARAPGVVGTTAVVQLLTALTYGCGLCLLATPRGQDVPDAPPGRWVGSTLALTVGGCVLLNIVVLLNSAVGSYSVMRSADAGADGLLVALWLVVLGRVLLWTRRIRQRSLVAVTVLGLAAAGVNGAVALVRLGLWVLREVHPGSLLISSGGAWPLLRTARLIDLWSQLATLVLLIALAMWLLRALRAPSQG